MKCPPDVAEVLSEIIYWGVIRTRGFGFGGDAKRCAHETDHIHNLPRLMQNYSPDLLLYYWNLERPSFVKKVPEVRVFEDYWAALQPLVERECTGHDVLPARSPETPADQLAAT